MVNEQITIKLQINPANDIAAMHDRASVNTRAYEILKPFYRHMVDIGCLSHALSNVGKTFDVPHLKAFEESYNSALKLSGKARRSFKAIVGFSLNTGTRTRWYTAWENYRDIMQNFQKIQEWIDNCAELDTCKSNVEKMRNIVYKTNSRDDMIIELCVIVDFAERFVLATYNLEGDGFLAPFVFDQIQDLIYSVQMVRVSANQNTDEVFLHFPNISMVIRELLGQNRSAYALVKLKNVIRRMIKYFFERFDLNSGILKMELELFRCLKLLNPENHKHNEYGAEDIEKLCRFTPFQSMRNDLIKELPVMKRLAANFESSHDILLWFKQRSDEIGTWYEAAKLCALIQPSSGSAERAFSLLEIAQNENQSSSLLDYQETSIMLRYNRQMREVESK